MAEKIFTRIWNFLVFLLKENMFKFSFDNFSSNDNMKIRGIRLRLINFESEKYH